MTFKPGDRFTFDGVPIVCVEGGGSDMHDCDSLSATIAQLRALYGMGPVEIHVNRESYALLVEGMEKDGMVVRVETTSEFEAECRELWRGVAIAGPPEVSAEAVATAADLVVAEYRKRFGGPGQ